LIAVLAIAGIPPFAGFFSKEEILSAAWAGGHPGTFVAGLATGGLTAFYMTRYFLLTFHGKRGGHADHGGDHGEPHESWVMALPILILAVPSLFAGWSALAWFRASVIPPGIEAEHAHHVGWLPFVATGIAFLGVGIGWLLYGRDSRTVGYPEGKAPGWFTTIQRRFYIDDLYVWLARTAAGKGVATPSNGFERVFINGSFDALAWMLRRFAGILVRIQNGQLQLYLALAILGLFILYRSTRGFGG
jgi:NADH-quinone oxidoreductase subunit L